MRNLKRVMALAALTTFAHTHAQTSKTQTQPNNSIKIPFQFKGIGITDTPATAKEKLSLFCELSPKNTTRAEMTCAKTKSSVTTFAGAPAKDWHPYTLSIDDKIGLIHAEFATQYFQQIADALTEKYGEPSKSSKEKVQTKAGVDFENEILTWTRQDSIMELKQYGSSITEASFSITSHEYTAKKLQARKEVAKINAQDL